MKKYPQVLKNLQVGDRAAVMNNEKVLACRDEITKRLGGDGRILLRESGTEPLIRVMVEAETTEKCEAEVSKMIECIRAEGLA